MTADETHTARWRTGGSHVVAHAAEGRRTVVLIPRISGYEVRVLDSVLLGAGFASAIRVQVDPEVRDEVLAWIDRPTRQVT